MIMDMMEMINMACYIITAASFITRLTPSTKDDEIVGKLMKVVKALSVPPKEPTGKKRR